MLSEGRVALSTGTLYGALGRLLAQGVIRKSSDVDLKIDPEIDHGSVTRPTRERKYYELTPFGRRVLSVELNRMAAILAAASREFGGEGV